jgi:inosose dehydratase
MPDLKYGYAINQWDPVRREQQERAFKVLDIGGFKAVELNEGSARWAPLGRREEIETNFDSVERLADFLHSCGIERISSWFYDPARPAVEEASGGRSASNALDHQGIIDSTRNFARTLQELGGSCLVVRPMGSYWREAPITDEKLKIAADCWNRVGQMTQTYGVQTAVHPDFLSAVRSPDGLDKLLSLTDSIFVGLAIDTAEVTIAGYDPVKLFEKYASRVKHFHFKDTHDKDTDNEYELPNADFLLLSSGGKRKIDRWFWEMGTPEGLVDFPTLIKSLKAHNYGGWVVVESDQSPDPSESALLNGYYVRTMLAKA